MWFELSCEKSPATEYGSSCRSAETGVLPVRPPRDPATIIGLPGKLSANPRVVRDDLALFCETSAPMDFAGVHSRSRLSGATLGGVGEARGGRQR